MRTMKRNSWRPGLLALTLAAAAPMLAVAAPAGEPLLSNGDLTRLDAQGWPVDWPHGEGITAEQEGKVHFLRLKSGKPNQMVMLYRRAGIPSPAPAGVEVRLRVRYLDPKPGEPKWHDGRVMAHFKSADGRTLRPEPPTPSFQGTSNGWVE